MQLSVKSVSMAKVMGGPSSGTEEAKEPREERCENYHLDTKITKNSNRACWREWYSLGVEIA